MRIWLNKNRLLLLALSALIGFTAIWASIEPKQCPICEGLRCHAPCLINLHTGEIGELELYEPHPFMVGELAETQQEGYFCFITVAGLRGTRTAGPWVLNIDIPADEKPIKRRLYCKECREVLAKTADNGYAILDLYDRSAPVVFPIQDGMEYTLRCYEISINMNVEKHVYHLEISGNLE